MFEGAAWQLRVEGSTVVVMEDGVSQAGFEEELVRIVDDAAAGPVVFEWSGPLVSIRVFTGWERVLFWLGCRWSVVCRWGRRLAGRG